MFQFDSDTTAEPLGAIASTTAPPIVATDGERLMRFRRHRDEAALAEVVDAHAGMVWGVCSQVLRHRQDAEDAFQATFLILARKAKAIRAADSAAGWLYRVAFRTSLLVRSQRQRRAEEPLIETPAAAADQFAAVERSEQCHTLMEELHALPDLYRQPLVLCYFEGRSRREAADELGVTPASIKGRLARGTRLLRTRLVRRGVALSTAMAVASAEMAAVQAAAPAALAGSTAGLAASFALKSTWKSTGGALKGSYAATLAEQGILAMTIASAAKPAAVLLAICLTTGALAVATADPPPPAQVVDAVTLLVDAAESQEAAPVREPSVEVTPAPQVLVPAEEGPQRIRPVGLAAQAAAMLSENHFADPNSVVQPLAYRPPSIQPTMTSQSRAAMQLEMEYWELKSRGLREKAEALNMKASTAEEARLTKPEAMEAHAEMLLTQAEMKLCEANAVRLRESLDAMDAGTLKSGAVGPHVETLQKALNERVTPKPNLDVDGEFGPLTEQAVKTFQKAHGLKADGIVDAALAARLGVLPILSAAAANPNLYGTPGSPAPATAFGSSAVAPPATRQQAPPGAYRASQPMPVEEPRQLERAAADKAELDKLRTENAALKKRLRASEKAARGEE